MHIELAEEECTFLLENEESERSLLISEELRLRGKLWMQITTAHGDRSSKVASTIHSTASSLVTTPDRRGRSSVVVDDAVVQSHVVVAFDNTVVGTATAVSQSHGGGGGARPAAQLLFKKWAPRNKEALERWVPK
ncbi:Hypothetical protein, putative [Bodo saltans]|uniref:Uncharacterized protein n=1 Tax=Bodo saltans TaxID=75058 RepID=A0A0S4ING9_BODSA|nr:Hypothetical protein, putative [Bodo saltans]|eukprot:CUE74830.1 Hypothetical protein, putative [Bodo saltans]